MASERRVTQVNVLIREVVARLLAEEMPSTDEGMITVTRVESSADLYYATVFVSVLSAHEARGEALFENLQRITGTIQFRLNRELRMRPVPKIRFEIDKDEARRERVEKLLAEEEKKDD
jgi:ribosome-binding factor A